MVNNFEIFSFNKKFLMVILFAFMCLSSTEKKPLVIILYNAKQKGGLYAKLATPYCNQTNRCLKLDVNDTQKLNYYKRERIKGIIVRGHSPSPQTPIEIQLSDFVAVIYLLNPYDFIILDTCFSGEARLLIGLLEADLSADVIIANPRRIITGKGLDISSDFLNDERSKRNNYKVRCCLDGPDSTSIVKYNPKSLERLKNEYLYISKSLQRCEFKGKTLYQDPKLLYRDFDEKYVNGRILFHIDYHMQCPASGL